MRYTSRALASYFDREGIRSGRTGPRISLWLLAVATTCGLSGAAPNAFAHSEFSEARPAQNAVLSEAPTQITIRFKQPLEPRFSKIALHKAGNGALVAGKSGVDPSDQRVLILPLPRIAAGAYTVRWVVVALDGHRTRGEYHFVLR